MEFLQDPITVRPLRLAEDVETSEPGREREPGQQQNRNRPGEVIDSAPDRSRIRFVVTIETVVHLNGRQDSWVRVQCPGSTGVSFAASNDVPHPQVRLAFGFVIWKPVPVRPPRKSRVASRRYPALSLSMKKATPSRSTTSSPLFFSSRVIS